MHEQQGSGVEAVDNGLDACSRGDLTVHICHVTVLVLRLSTLLIGGRAMWPITGSDMEGRRRW